MALSMVFISFKVFIHFCWWNNEWYAGNSWLIWNKLNKVYEHHKDTKLFQDKFHNDKKVFKETLKNLRNSFLEQEPQLVHNISKKLLDQVIESVKCSKHIGNHQFKSFVTEHLIEGTSSLYNTIKKNSLACIIKKNIVPIKQKVVNLSYDCRIYFEFMHSLSSKRSWLRQIFCAWKSCISSLHLRVWQIACS